MLYNQKIVLHATLRIHWTDYHQGSTPGSLIQLFTLILFFFISDIAFKKYLISRTLKQLVFATNFQRWSNWLQKWHQQESLRDYFLVPSMSHSGCLLSSLSHTVTNNILLQHKWRPTMLNLTWALCSPKNKDGLKIPLTLSLPENS